MTKKIDELTLPKTTASDGESDGDSLLTTEENISTDIFYGKYGFVRKQPKPEDYDYLEYRKAFEVNVSTSP